MTSHPYTCRFCNLAGQALDGEGADPGWTAKLLPLVVCNRCADYRTGLDLHGERIRKCCIALNVARVSLKKAKLDEAEESIRLRLVDATKDYAEHVCAYHRLTLVWEPDFADMCMENPNKVNAILSGYRQGLPKLRQEHQTNQQPNEYDDINYADEAST